MTTGPSDNGSRHSSDAHPASRDPYTDAELFHEAAAAVYLAGRTRQRRRFDEVVGNSDALDPCNGAVAFLTGSAAERRYPVRVETWAAAGLQDVADAVVDLTDVTEPEVSALITAVLHFRIALGEDVLTYEVRTHAERAAAALAGLRRDRTQHRRR